MMDESRLEASRSSNVKIDEDAITRKDFVDVPNKSNEGSNDDDDALQDLPLQFGNHITLYDTVHVGYVFCSVSGGVHSGLMVKPTERATPTLGNFKTAVFQVIPQSKYKAQKNLRAVLDELRREQHTPDLTLKEALLNANDDLVELNNLAQAEIHELITVIGMDLLLLDNKLEQARRNGSSVVYGQIVQLWHPYSECYVRVSSTVTSPVEPSNMRVELDPVVSRSSWFRIMPRYKVRAEGERVRMGDRIVLESVKTGGQFVHTAAHIQPDERNIIPGCRDISTSVSPTAFTVYPHMGYRAPNDKKIRGGDFIQLFHKEISAYLAAEGSSYESSPREQVHMRIREPDSRRPHRLQPPTSAVSFWQIEIDGHLTSGDPIEWETKIRLKHATTQQYLKLCTDEYLPDTSESSDNLSVFGSSEAYRFEATGGELKLALTNNPRDPDAVFLMTAVIRENTEVENGSYTRIQHCATGHWLHAAKSRPYHRQWKFHLPNDTLATPLYKRLESVEWDRAELKLATCTRNRMFDDAFIIQRVPFKNVAYLAYVSGMVDVIRFFIRSRQQGELSSWMYRGFQQALREYTKYLSSGRSFNRQKQKLLRNLGIIELLITLLQIPFAQYGLVPNGIKMDELNQSKDTILETKRLLIRGYKLLSAFLTGDSRKNELYICKHVPFFLTQLGYDLDMETMYTALVKDNQQIIGALSEDEIKQIVDLLRNDRDPRYLQFLSVLCSVNGVAIGENQKTICKFLLEGNNPPVYLTKLENGQVSIKTSDTESWISLITFSNSTRKSGQRSERRKYDFFVSQLQLFGELCLQRCEYAIQIITRTLDYLGWEECFACISNDSLPAALRENYVTVMMNLFIDVDGNTDILEEVQLCFEWSKLSSIPYAAASDDPSISLTGARMPFFSVLNEWLHAFLRERQSLEANMEETNLLIASVLRLTKMLVAFGYFANPGDIERLVIPMRGLLCGLNDRPSREPGEQRYALEDNGHSFRRNTLEMDTTDQHLITEWRNRERFERSKNNAAMVAVKLNALDVLDTIINFCLSVRIELFCYDFQQVVAWSGDRRQTRQARVGKVFHFKDLHDGPTMHFETMQCLSRLSRTMQSDDPYDFTETVRLYLGELFDRSNYICPKWRPQTSAFRSGDSNDLVEVLLDLAKYKYPKLTCKSLQLLNRLYKATENLFEYSIHAQLLIDPDSINLANKLKKYAPILRRLGAGQIELGEMEEFNSILIELSECCILDRLNPHVINQHMIVNHGIANILFDVLDHANQPAEVLSSVFRCLSALAANFPRVQTAFYDRFTKILTLETNATGWENDLADAIHAVFTHNKELSLLLSADQVELMMSILIAHNVRVPRLVKTLCSIAWCEELGVPLPRNQNLIMKNLMKTMTDTVNVTHIDVDSTAEVTAKRIELCEYEGGDTDILQRQRYHANMVSLIAQCAQGYTRFIESTCMTLLSIEEILSILISEKTPLFVKTSYMRFFNFVYLETTASPIEAGTQDLYSDMRLWNCLHSLITNFLGRFYRNMEKFERHLLSEDDESFLYDGLLPWMTAIMQDHYHPKDCSTCQPLVAEAAEELFSFADRAVEQIFQHQHMKTLSMAVLSMKRAGKSPAPRRLIERIGTALRTHEAELVQTPSKRAYKAKFSKQEELNSIFNSFVCTVRESYFGRNEMTSQLYHLDFKSHKSRPYCESKGSDEALPLGPDFQYFVALFIMYDISGKFWKPVGLRPDILSLVHSLKASHRFFGTLEAKDQYKQEQLDIRSLQTLRCILHNQARCESELESFQNEMAQYDAVLPVADMLAAQSDTVVREALALLVALLQDGNKLAQESFYRLFVGTREETFFHDILKRVRRSIESVREVRFLRATMEFEQNKTHAMLGTITMLSELDKNGSSSPENNKEATDVMELKPLPIHTSKPIKKQLSIKDDGYIELVLRVLQNLCEGHNRSLQDYLRFQPDNMHPINLVEVTVEFLATMMDDISNDTMGVITQTVDTLIEFCQGCQSNQQSVFDAKVVDAINFLIRIPRFYEFCEQKSVAKLHLGCATLILAMLENSDEKTHKMAMELEETLDIEHMFMQMRHYSAVYAKKLDNNWQTKNDIEDPISAQEVASAFFICIVRLEDFTQKNYHDDPQYNPLPTDSTGELGKQSFDQLKRKVSSIEILRDGQPHRVHYLNLWKDKIRPTVKEELKWNVNRGSPAERFVDFLERSKVIVADIKYFDRVMASSPISHILLKYTSQWRQAMLFFTFMINVLILSTWRAPYSYNVIVPVTDFSGYDALMGFFGAFHLFFSALVTASFFILQPPDLSLTFPSFAPIQRIFPTNADDHRTRSNILEVSSIYHVLLVIFSIMGLFLHGYFYCFHLLNIIVRNDILLRVLKSVTKNGNSLLWVAGLMVIIIYIYSLISFAFLRKNFDQSEGAYCQTAFQCFITSLRLGLMSGGGLGEALPPADFSFYESGIRTIFDISFFVIITIIGLNVVFGIIVDSFSQLRDEKYQTQEIMESECFICGLKAFDFERLGNGFDFHVHHEHNLWDYVAFFLHLEAKDRTEYTAHEQYVADQLASGQYGFFPVNHALSLEGRRDTGVEDRLERLERTLQGVIERMDEEARNRSAEERRREIKESMFDLQRQSNLLRQQGQRS